MSSPATLLVVRVKRPAHDVDAVVRVFLVGSQRETVRSVARDPVLRIGPFHAVRSELAVKSLALFHVKRG
jgi:hypothetical protein